MRRFQVGFDCQRRRAKEARSIVAETHPTSVREYTIIDDGRHWWSLPRAKGVHIRADYAKQLSVEEQKALLHKISEQGIAGTNYETRVHFIEPIDESTE